MLGHKNGMMDYVWILSQGKMRLYPNKGLTFVSDSGESYWGANRIIWDPTQLAINRPLDRRDLHLADWDGDGACDIIWTDPDNTNRVRVWRNRILENDHQDFDWEYLADPAPELYCPETRGLGFFDHPVQFADISGNRMADYLCVERDGRTWGFLNHGPAAQWEYIDQIKFSESKDRANLHWADVNGDGLADLIHTNKFNGDGTVWYNRGRRDIGGSRFHWEPVGVKYQGAVAGSCTYFPDLNGDHRADMHAITHSTVNRAETWYNDCAGKDNGGDDGEITDPSLPDMRPSPKPCQTVSSDTYPSAPTILGEPIEGNSYFQIASACTKQSINHPGFRNKGEFMVRAWKDATIMADSARDWPLYGHDASDLFFAPGAHDGDYTQDIAGEYFQLPSLEKIPDVGISGEKQILKP
jgi:hypothetical protein